MGPYEYGDYRFIFVCAVGVSRLQLKDGTI